MTEKQSYPELRWLANHLSKAIVYVVKRMARGIVNIARIIVAIDERLKTREKQ